MHLVLSRARQLQTSVQRHISHQSCEQVVPSIIYGRPAVCFIQGARQTDKRPKLEQLAVGVHTAHTPEATTPLSHSSSALQNLASVSLRDSVFVRDRICVG